MDGTHPRRRAGSLQLLREHLSGEIPRKHHSVSFDVLPSELQNPRRLKMFHGRFQQMIPGRVDLTTRNPKFGVSGFNAVDAAFRYGVPAAGVVGGGFAAYDNLKGEKKDDKQ